MSKSQIAGSVVAGFPSPAEQYLEPPLDLNELLVKRPAEKYLKDRKNRALSQEELKHYQRIILALAKTREIMDGLI